MPLVLAAPGLLLPPDAPEEMRALRLPRLERWLARGRLARGAAGGLEQWLAREAGIAGVPPIAAVTLASDRGGRAEGAWLRADPVHVRMGQDSASLHEGAALAITADEARALVAALNAHFAADGLQFEAPVPERWYVAFPEADLPRTTPLDEVAGRDILPRLPRSPAGRNRGLATMTEAQMVLAAHPVNTDREATGRPAVNGIWLWGEGILPAEVALPFSRVHADDPFARGMAGLAGAAVEPAAAALGPVPAGARGERILVVEDRPARALRRGSVQEWIAAARECDALLGGLADAIGRFGGVRLALPGPRHTLEATFTSRWHWPRRAAPLSSHA